MLSVQFFCDGWCLFDFFIVAMSLISLGPVNLPASILRCLRAFRVMRLFARVKAVRQILSALSQSIIPVMNSFLIMFIVACIYAIIGVSFFRDTAPDDFISFDRSFLALFRVIAGETWIDSLDRITEDGKLNGPAVVFIFSFIVIVNWTLLQVSVAVLLDKFVSATAEMEQEERDMRVQAIKKTQQVHNTLDPLLEKMTRDYVDEEDLTNRLSDLFSVLDSDSSGKICFAELCAELKKLDFNPPIHLSDGDFAVITEQGKGTQLCDADGFMDFSQFQRAMKNQIFRYAQRNLCNVIAQRSVSEAELATMGMLKMTVAQLAQTKEGVLQVQSDVAKLAAMAGDHQQRTDENLKALSMDIQRLLATCAAQPQTATVAPPSEVPTTATVRVMSSRSAAPGGRQLPPPAAPAALQPTCALSTAPMLSTPSKPDADLSSPLHPLLQSPDTDLWLPPSSVEIVSGPLGCSESRENPTAPESRGGEPMMLYPSRKRAGLSSRAVRVGNGAEPAGLDSRSAQAPLSDIPGSGHGGPGSLVTSPSESEDDSDLINGACFNVDLAPQNRRDGEYRQRPMPRKEGDPRGTWSPSVSEPANGIASSPFKGMTTIHRHRVSRAPSTSAPATTDPRYDHTWDVSDTPPLRPVQPHHDGKAVVLHDPGTSHVDNAYGQHLRPQAKPLSDTSPGSGWRMHV
jgi:Ca2+-binding EF-hand superfamily protein